MNAPTLDEQEKWFAILVDSNNRHGFDPVMLSAILASLQSLKSAKDALPEPVAEIVFDSTFEGQKLISKQRPQIFQRLNDVKLLAFPFGTKLYSESALLSEVAKREKAESELAELRPDAMRYRSFRAMVSRGDLTNKQWRAAFEAWFARYYPESDLDALIDKALPNLIDAFNGDAPFPNITKAMLAAAPDKELPHG